LLSEVPVIVASCKNFRLGHVNGGWSLSKVKAAAERPSALQKAKLSLGPVTQLKFSELAADA